MKKFLKTVNRGVILAVLVIVCVAVYVAVENAGFRSEKPEIEQMVQQYLEEVRAINLASPGEREQMTRELLEKYWVSTEQNGYYGFDKKDMIRYLDQQSERIGREPEISNYTALVKNLAVSQNGPGGAKVGADYSASLEMSEEDLIYPIYGIGASEGYFTSSAPSQDGVGYVQSVECRLEIVLCQSEGQWKISGMTMEWNDR